MYEILQSHCQYIYIYLALHKKRQSVKKPGSKNRKQKELIFVGIHCRRTDHIEFEKDHSQIPVDLDYYFEAMDMFRKRMNNKKEKVVFVYVSDDMAWGKKKIGTKDKKGWQEKSDSSNRYW